MIERIQIRSSSLVWEYRYSFADRVIKRALLIDLVISHIIDILAVVETWFCTLKDAQVVSNTKHPCYDNLGCEGVAFVTRSD